MYESLTRVTTQGGDTEYFPIIVGLHQSSSRSPYLVALVLDVLNDHI